MRAEVITVEKCEVKQLPLQSKKDCGSAMGDGRGCAVLVGAQSQVSDVRGEKRLPANRQLLKIPDTYVSVKLCSSLFF